MISVLSEQFERMCEKDNAWKLMHQVFSKGKNAANGHLVNCGVDTS